MLLCLYIILLCLLRDLFKWNEVLGGESKRTENYYQTTLRPVCKFFTRENRNADINISPANTSMNLQFVRKNENNGKHELENWGTSSSK